MSEVKIVEIGMVDGKISMKVDPNKDSQPVLVLKLNMSEAFKETFNRADAVKDVKIVKFSLEGSKLMLALDTDKDGVDLLELEIDFMEALDEIS